MKIEEGKFYRTRLGFKAGPAKRGDLEIWPWNLHVEDDEPGICCYRDNGTEDFSEKYESKYDLVSEWDQCHKELSPISYEQALEFENAALKRKIALLKQLLMEIL